jgi:hypothetical protein
VESVTGCLAHLAAGKNIAIDVAVPIIEMRNDLKAMHQVLFICLHLFCCRQRFDGSASLPNRMSIW